MNRTLTSPDTLHTVQIGAVTFTAQRTVDAGVTVTVWNGPSRHNTATWSYTDPTLGRARWQTIAHLAATGLTATQIADTLNSDAGHALAQVRDLLDDAHAEAVNSCHSLARAVTAALDEVETDADRAQLDKLAADVARTVEQSHGQCAADEPEVDEAALIAFADTVANATTGLRDDQRPATLAQLAAAYRATHPAVPTLAEARRRRARRASLAYDTAKARADR